MSKYCLLICSILFVFACSSKKADNSNKLYEKLEQFVSKIDKNFQDVQVVYVIPKQACGNCVKEAVAFAKMYAQNKRILFVGVDFQSKKEARLTHGAEFANLSNLFLDTKKSIGKYEPIDGINLNCYVISHQNQTAKYELITPQKQFSLHGQIRSILKKH